MALQEMLLVAADEIRAGECGAGAGAPGARCLVDLEDETGLAGFYAGQLAAQLQELEVLLRSADPNLRTVRARLQN